MTDTVVIRHRDRAAGHLAAVDEFRHQLRQEYAKADGYRDRALIADLNADIGHGLKAAEVEAILAVSAALIRR